MSTTAAHRVLTGIGGSGVAGILSNGDGPRLLLRAELPVKEATGLDHACRPSCPGRSQRPLSSPATAGYRRSLPRL